MIIIAFVLLSGLPKVLANTILLIKTKSPNTNEVNA
jgi:hypothetical protein